MTNQEFKAWLLGYKELAGDVPVNERQIRIIKNHSNLVIAIDGFLNQENQAVVDHLGVLMSQKLIPAEKEVDPKNETVV